MKIINNTVLNYCEIGQLIDQIMEYPEDTHYYGQIQVFKFQMLRRHEPKSRTIQVQIRYLKRYCELIFSEVKKDETSKK